MDEQLKQRLVGAAVLISLAVIFIPMLLDSRSGPQPTTVAPRIPPKPKGEFSSGIVPVPEPKTPLLDAQRQRQAEAARQAAAVATAVPVPETPGEPAAKSTSAAAPAPAPSAPPPPAPTSAPPAAAAPQTPTVAAPTPALAAAKGATAAAPPAVAGPTAWAVQLGSFSNAQNALGLRDRLRKKGYRAFIETAHGGNGDVTRVYVGPELERNHAVEIVNKLYAETKLKGIVVRYPGS